ncbi:MAG: hypothetical protein IJ617_06840 [Oscillospiraceae bacterium]|nr:hypothetical protein [Oscillospiraceae bacterium]
MTDDERNYILEKMIPQCAALRGALYCIQDSITSHETAASPRALALRNCRDSVALLETDLRLFAYARPGSLGEESVF